MGNSLLKANKREAHGEIDQIAIDYKLKLIAFQDELFQSRKKLQDSDRKMSDLQKKLDEYVRNKENQIAEVVFTAHMNTQRIEAQTRSQTEYIILEMEEEMRRKEKELDLLQKKTNRFIDDTTPDIDSEDIGARLQVVQDNIRAFREQIETTKIEDNSQDNSKQTKTAKIKELRPDKEQAVKTEKEDKLVEEVTIQVVEDEKFVQPVTTKKRRVVTKKSDKSKTKIEQVNTLAQDIPVAINEAAATETLDTQCVAEVQEQATAANTADNNFEAEYDNYRAASLLEPNERMRLDAFVDVRYYNNIAGQREMQHHALQVTIEVDVPPDNYTVRYTKVSSDVVSTLLQFDNVILNDIFPFNIIEPNPQNIATYFFNCLDDMLSMMDLELHSLVALELPDLQIKVNTRNTKLDNFLHQDVDVLDSIRDSLIPCVESEGDTISPLKGTFSRILKKRN